MTPDHQRRRHRTWRSWRPLSSPSSFFSSRRSAEVSQPLAFM